MRFSRLVTLVVSTTVFVSKVHGTEAVWEAVYKNPKAKQLLMTPKDLLPAKPKPDISVTFENALRDPTFNEVWCHSATYTYWSNSRHPGHKYVDLLNQDQDGFGIKCRKTGRHPTFFSVDGMTNSQFGETFAVSVGKQLDLLEYKGVKLYVGISLTGISYKRPERQDTVYGVAPFRHRGISWELPWYQLGTIGWEEQRLPVGNIRLRSWHLKVVHQQNFF